MPRKKHWSKMVEEAGVKIRVFEREHSSSLWYSLVHDGTKRRRTLRTTDRDLAENRVRAIARSVAEMQLTGVDPRRLTLAQVFGRYFLLKGPSLTKSWRKLAEARRGLFESCWCTDKVVVDISQTDVDLYCRLRRTGTLTPLGRGEGRGDRSPVKVRDGTLDGDFRWLSSVFNWARRHKEGGRRFLPENPLHDVTWPKEQNPRRPVASQQRFVKTMEKVDGVDSSGRLRCVLALARYTGRRAEAICELRTTDVLRTEDQVRVALATAGMDERLADHMPHGAIRWSDQSDKMGLLFVSPLSQPARAAVEEYLRANPRVGDTPLFPSPEDDSQSIRRDVLARWLLKAEAVAELPKLQGGILHPYRRLWATERKSLPDVDVAAAGGWKDTRALKLSYQHADPAAVLQVVNFGT